MPAAADVNGQEIVVGKGIAGSARLNIMHASILYADHSVGELSLGASYFAAPFAQKNFSILLDRCILGEQDRAEVSPFEARLPLRSPSAVSLKAKLRVER